MIKYYHDKLIQFQRKMAETSDEAVILCLIAQINEEVNNNILLAEQCVKSAEMRLEYLGKITPSNIYKHFERDL